jgi:putative membrane protein
MKTIKVFSMALLVCALSACQGTDKSGGTFDDSSKLDEQADSAARSSDHSGPDNETNESNVDEDGATFMKTATLSGKMEVELGQLAQSQASNPRVRAFGSKMVTDHEKANSELKAIAEKNGILLPSEYPADVKAHIESMKKLKGAAFDKHYMDMMANDHVKTLNLFKNAGVGKDVLKDFVGRTLPMLESHHRLAVEINNVLK